MTTSRLDAIDRAIIDQLQLDGRRAYTQLAKDVGLSEAAVRQRVQRLLDSEAMQIVAVTDPLAGGLNRQAMIAVSVDGDVRPVAQAIAEFDEAVYVVATAGSTDILCEVVVPNDAALLDLINDRIRPLPGVRNTDTTIYLQLYKQTYQWSAK